MVHGGDDADADADAVQIAHCLCLLAHGRKIKIETTPPPSLGGDALRFSCALAVYKPPPQQN
jgi:hypothetical protein